MAIFVAIFLSKAEAKHAIAQYGEPKYPAHFTHFDYVNPHAPKGGTLTFANPSHVTSFDKFNPFSLRGFVAPGIAYLMFETLATSSADEPASAYGLLADDIEVAADGLSVTFRIHPSASFSNGDPVTAADVKYSFDTLMGPQAAPNYKVQMSDVLGATVLDQRRVRFDFSLNSPELPLLVGSLPVFSSKWSVGVDGKHRPFDQLTFEKPIGSGPYLIEYFEVGHRIAFHRNPNYWGQDLPVRRGMYNFERVVYKLYGDNLVRLEAFKAGEFDVNFETCARSWAFGYTGKKFSSGELVQKVFKHHNSAGMYASIFNLRRPFFQDVRVRRALGLALDFEWLNRQLFYHQYTRINSLFANSELATKGWPNEAELKLLMPLREQLDPAVFGPMLMQPSTHQPSSLRDNLRQARELLAQAGWTYRDGALRNIKGEPFVFEFLDAGGSMVVVVSPFVRNLAKLGIEVHIRSMDHVLYQKRVDVFDFDMIIVSHSDSQLPGPELLERFSSKSADIEGSENILGLKSSAVDVLVENIVRAHTREALEASAHALDRVIMHGYYVIPHWLSGKHRVAFRHTLRYPATLPRYYTAEGWVVSTWWDDAPVTQSALTYH